MSQSEFLSLQINLNEVLKTSNLNRWYFDFLIDKNSPKLVYLIAFLSGSFLSIVVRELLSLSGLNLRICIFISLFFGVISIPIIENLSIDSWKRCKHLIKIYQEVINFNSLIEGVDALDQAERSGSAKRLENREKLIEILTVMRADLICALRIEKVVRENPSFNSSDFTLNLEPLKFLQLSEPTSEYGRLFNEALQIGMSVQEEMQLLQKK